MLHLIKLAVGARSLDDIASRQAARTPDGEPVTVFTRQFPRRSAELEEGGSLYWVVAGLVLGRQEITGIAETVRADGTRGTAIRVAPALVKVAPRHVRAFQGWRYLAGDDAPADLPEGDDAAGDTLPPELRRRLAELCLI